MAWRHFRFHDGDKGCSLNENEVMWNNSTIKINGVSVFYKHWYRKGMYKIAHVMDDSDNFLSFENFQAKCNYLEYQGIVSAIKHSNCFLKFKEKDASNYILQQNKVQSFQPNAQRHGKPPSQTKSFNGNSYSAWFSKLPSTQSFKLFSSNFASYYMSKFKTI